MVRKALACVAACGAAASIASAQTDAAPDVSYTVSGTSGNYLLDFTVGANVDEQNEAIYFFGVLLDTGRNIAGSPDRWDPDAWSSWSMAGYGGSSNVYNNNWINFDFNGSDIGMGESQSGFQAIYTGATAPQTVDWFAFEFGGTYTGSDPFLNSATNPGFEGTAVIPAPGALALLGLGGLAAARRRR